MEVTKKLNKAWFDASQSYFKGGEEKFNVAMKSFYKDLKDNGPVYLSSLSKCDCCDRHKMNRPSSVADYKEYQWTGNNNICSCSCACRHFCRIIVSDLSKSQ